MVEIYNSGREYWVVAKRYHDHRATNPGIIDVALRDMRRIQSECQCEAVRKRINSFIARHQPRIVPPPTGPRYA